MQIKIKNQVSPLILLGHLSFICLFILSFIFYKERVLFADTAFQFFKIVNFEKINIEAHRYGAILPEIPLLLAINLGISLKYLTIIYSISFIAVYYLCYILCTHFLRNSGAGFAIVLVLILCVSQSFFHPVTETHQSLVFCILFYAVLSFDGFRSDTMQFIFTLAIMILSFLTHPVSLFILIFLIGIFAIEKKQLKTIRPYFLLLTILILALIKVLFTQESSYEGQFFSEFLNFSTLLNNLTKGYSTQFFFSRAHNLFFWLILFELACIVVLTQKREWIKLIWQTTFLLIFLLIIFHTYHNGDSDLMMERAFMPLVVFVSIPLLHDLNNKLTFNNILKYFALFVVIFFCFTRIVKQGKDFQSRTEYNLSLLAKTAHFPNKKFIVNEKELSSHIILFWSYSFETLILSTITNNLPTQTIYPSRTPEEFSEFTKQDNHFFLGANFWLKWDTKELNSKYFILPDNQPYKTIHLDQP